MLEHSIDQRLGALRDASDRPSYLASHRALAACTREFTRLGDDVARGAAAITDAEERPVVRVTPNRCIVQLGPVALTLAWLRSTLDSVADGQLLVNVWQGTVAPKMTMQLERMAAHRAPAPATVLWEEVLMADAESEAAWNWRAASADAPDDGAVFSSSELALRAVERLRNEYARVTQLA